jgi:hypothetical protein
LAAYKRSHFFPLFCSDFFGHSHFYKAHFLILHCFAPIFSPQSFL